MKKVFVTAVLTTALFVGIAAQPAPAVVHEIYAAWCAGKGEIEPPGISRDGSKNFAMPVLKSGAVSVHPIGTPTVPVAGILIDIDFDAPNVKLHPDRRDHPDRGDPRWASTWRPSSSIQTLPAFANCANLQIPG